MAASNSTNMPTESQAGSFQEGSTAVLLASCVEIILCLLGTVGNSLTITVVCENRSLQVVSYFLLASLAFADLLVSAILVPMRASQHMALYHGRTSLPKAVVEIAGFVGRVNIIASISSLAAMSIDRYVALSRPIFYLTSVKFAKGKVSIAIALIWTVSIFVTCLPKFPGVSDKPFLVFFVAFVLLVTLIIALTYYRIFKVVRKSVLKQRASSNLASKVVCLSVTSTSDSRLAHYAEERQTDSQAYAQKGERKAAKTIAFVIGAFVLLVYPRIILILYHFAASETAQSKHARFWIRILLYSNSVVNPALYAYRHNEFKREFKKIFLKCWQFFSCQKWEYLKSSSSNKTYSNSTPEHQNRGLEVAEEQSNDGETSPKEN
ncbi:hypothetical protein ACROYT_G041894 [Oculina patagonica]